MKDTNQFELGAVVSSAGGPTTQETIAEIGERIKAIAGEWGRNWHRRINAEDPRKNGRDKK